MPRIFLYEHVSALGLGRDPDSAEHTLFLEGRAMLSAVTADFAAVPGVDVAPFPDGIPPEHHSDTFTRLAETADWSLIIAPETCGELGRLTRLVVSAGGRLLGPTPDAVTTASDKSKLGNLWISRGVPTPKTFAPEEALVFPVVCKPRDGCGSQEVYLVHSAEELSALPPDPNRLIQPFVPGQAASVAFLIGPNGIFPLPPTFQRLSTDGRFCYRGGVLPIPDDIASRAVRLARRAIDSVPGLFGYVGVDLVLGEKVDGSGDVAIEINPRLTTSYVGLRAESEANLAAAMLDVCEGRPPDLRWAGNEVQFAADGSVNVRPIPPDDFPTPG